MDVLLFNKFDFVMVDELMEFEMIVFGFNLCVEIFCCE